MILKIEVCYKMNCSFKATKTNVNCILPVDNYYGFCTKHSKTLQAQQKMIEHDNKIVHGRKENIVRNQFNRFEHQESHIVFDMASQKAYGVQLDNGEVCELGDEEINLCRANGWSYQVKKPPIEMIINDNFDNLINVF